MPATTQVSSTVSHLKKRQAIIKLNHRGRKNASPDYIGEVHPIALPGTQYITMVRTIKSLSTNSVVHKSVVRTQPAKMNAIVKILMAMSKEYPSRKTPGCCAVRTAAAGHDGKNFIYCYSTFTFVFLLYFIFWPNDCWEANTLARTRIKLRMYEEWLSN